MKSKQLPLIEKCICLTILSFSSVHNSYFNKMALVGFQYEPASLDVNGDCLGHVKNQDEVKVLLNGADVRNME